MSQTPASLYKRSVCEGLGTGLLVAAVVGSGIMGSGIAEVAAAGGFEVIVRSLEAGRPVPTAISLSPYAVKCHGPKCHFMWPLNAPEDCLARFSLT